ncbi:hypothetical protein CY35_02G061800 [Sphagnum magellanicum]|nr:hypothetical protein CY35_02G061800 [Sphagnum magellanicum]
MTMLLPLSSSLEEEELVVRLQPQQVAVWFQNHRAHWKTKQLERDYQVLTSDYNRLKTQLEAAIEEKQELQAKVQGLSAGKGKPGDQEESLGCETAAAEGAAGDEVRKVIRVQESTAATEPSTLQQQLHPACSNDHAANDIQLMIKPESKLIMASTNDHITNLLSISQISRGTKGPVLTVQCPSEYQNQGLQVYAAKPVNIDGSYISVHSEPTHVAVVDVSESSTGAWLDIGLVDIATSGHKVLGPRPSPRASRLPVTGIDVMQAELVAQTTWRWQEKTEMVGSWKAKIYDMHNVQVGGAQYAKIWSNGCGC